MLARKAHVRVFIAESYTPLAKISYWAKTKMEYHSKFPWQGSTATPAGQAPSLGSLVVEIINEKVHSGLAAASLAFMFLLVGSISLALPADPSFNTGYPSSYASISKAKASVLGDSTTLPLGTVYPDARTTSPVKCRGGQLQTGQFCVYNFIDFAPGQHFVYPAPETTTNQNPYITTIINNDWDNGVIKGTSGRRDNVSIRWVGNVEFKKGLYSFNTRSDDGIRISVNSSRLNLSTTNGSAVEAYNAHGPTDFKGYAYVETPGTKEVVIEYFENAGLAVAKVSWDYLGEQATPRQINGITGVQRFNQNVTGNDAYVNTNEMVVGQFMILYGTFPSTGATVWIGGEQVPAENVKPAVSATATTSQINVELKKKYGTQTSSTGYYPVEVKSSTGTYAGSTEIRYQGDVVSATCPEVTPTTSVALNTFTGCYFDDLRMQDYKFSKLESNDAAGNLLNYNWGLNSPDSRLQPDTFSVRWTGNFNFSEAGNYKFTARADDGIRAWVDGQALLLKRADGYSNSYTDQGETEYTATKELTAGVHYIKVEYYENTGLAVAKFRYDKVIASTSQERPRINTPAVGATVNGKEVSVTATTGTMVGVTKMSLIIDDKIVGDMQSIGPANFYLKNFDSTLYSNGAHKIEVVATVSASTGVSAGFYYSGSQVLNINNASTTSPYSITGVQRVNQNLTGSAAYINTNEMVVGQYMVLYGTFPSSGATVTIGGELLPAVDYAFKTSPTATTDQINVFMEKEFRTAVSPTGFYNVEIKNSSGTVLATTQIRYANASSALSTDERYVSFENTTRRIQIGGTQQQIFGFTVTAPANFNVNHSQFKLEVGGALPVQLSNFKLYKSDGTLAGSLNGFSSGNAVSIVLDAGIIVVPAGQSVSFRLFADVSPNALPSTTSVPVSLVSAIATTPTAGITPVGLPLVQQVSVYSPTSTTKSISSVTVSPYTASNGQTGYIKGYPVQVSWTSNAINSFNAQLFIKSTDGSITPSQVIRTNITGNSIPNGAPIPTSVGTGAKAFIRICEYTGSFQDCNNGTTYKDSDEFTISEITNKAITAVITAPYTTSSGTTGYIKGYPISVSWTSTGLSIYTVELMLKFPDGSVGTAGGFISKTTATSVSLPIPTNIGNGATGFVRVCEWTTGTCTNGYSDVYKDSSTFTINDLNQGGSITTTTGYYQAETGTTIVSPMQSATDGSNVGHVFTPQANSGSVTIPFNTTGSTQTYIVWAKVIAPDSNTDSFVVSIDGGGEDIFDTNDLNTNGTITYVAKPTWQWVKVNGRGGTGSPAIIGTRAWSLAPGAHTITFKGRDANTKLDQVFITTNQTAVPQ